MIMNRGNLGRVSICLAVALLAMSASGSGVLRAQMSEASRKALESAAAKGNLAALYALGANAEETGSLEQARDLYSVAADGGYGGAQLKLAQMLETGRGGAADQQEALEWYKKAAAQGIEAAVSRLEQLEPSDADRGFRRC